MAQLLVRDLEPELLKRLKRRAAEHGHSAEEEHRTILRDALSGPATASFKDHLRNIPAAGEDADFERADDRGRRVRL